MGCNISLTINKMFWYTCEINILFFPFKLVHLYIHSDVDDIGVCLKCMTCFIVYIIFNKYNYYFSGEIKGWPADWENSTLKTLKNQFHITVSFQ